MSFIRLKTKEKGDLTGGASLIPAGIRKTSNQKKNGPKTTKLNRKKYWFSSSLCPCFLLIVIFHPRLSSLHFWRSWKTNQHSLVSVTTVSCRILQNRFSKPHLNHEHQSLITNDLMSQWSLNNFYISRNAMKQNVVDVISTNFHSNPECNNKELCEDVKCFFFFKYHWSCSNETVKSKERLLKDFWRHQ